MEGQSQEFTARAPADFRPFAVEAFVGRRASGWPFSRFDISSRELRVRLSFPWFTTRSQQSEAIRSVVVTRRIGDMYCIRYDDTVGNFRDVHVHPLYGRQQMIDELRRCGYEVVDDAVRGGSRWRRRRN
jgi:hypothetical protein